MNNLAGEQRYEQVYGDTFALYSREEMLEFIEPFRVRFAENQLDPRQLFQGKRCLDAACGNGRGALFMLMHGAMHVTACDISVKNVASTRSFLQQFGYSNAEVSESSLEQLPYADESFDFVWCNGVLMHTQHPNRCLQQIARVLKRGGNSWIYVYGSGGVYWRTIQYFRTLLSGVSIAQCIAALRLFRYETRYVAEFIDDWFATHLRSYTHGDFGKALLSVGFGPAEPLPRGMPYDTSHRRSIFGGHEAQLMGEGDLRYLLTKQHATPATHTQILDEGEYGSSVDWPEIIRHRLDPALEQFGRQLNGSWQKIAAAAHVQRELRLQMSRPEALDLQPYLDLLGEVGGHAANCSDVL